MSKKSKRSRAAEFSKKARYDIMVRDRGNCIFCEMEYLMNDIDEWGKNIKDIMHYIPRSSGGLGIPQNGAVGCRYHHSMFDNGNNGKRGEMKELFREYLKRIYPGWDESKVVYSKWNFLEGAGKND